MKPVTEKRSGGLLSLIIGGGLDESNIKSIEYI